MNTRKLLFNQREEEYKIFSSKLIQTKYEMLGVRIPLIDKMAGNLAKQGGYSLPDEGNAFYEEILLFGFVLAKTKAPVKEKLLLYDKYLSFVDNWALCDMFCSRLKEAKTNKDIFLQYILKKLTSKSTYDIRFAIVMLLSYYIDKEHLPLVFELLSGIKSEEYYVNMAIAWCYSVCAAKFFDESYEFLKKNLFNDFTHNKSIQKCRESFRISAEQKAMLNELKR